MMRKFLNIGFRLSVFVGALGAIGIVLAKALKGG